jgi:hypothetical protein
LVFGHLGHLLSEVGLGILDRANSLGERTHKSRKSIRAKKHQHREKQYEYFSGADEKK